MVMINMKPLVAVGIGGGGANGAPTSLGVEHFHILLDGNPVSSLQVYVTKCERVCYLLGRMPFTVLLTDTFSVVFSPLRLPVLGAENALVSRI